MLAQELPEPDGMWTFSNADNLLAADKGTLQLLPAVTGRKSITLCELSEANITAAEGPSSTNAIMVPAASALKVQRLEGAEATTSYTLMMDVKVLDANAYDGLFQTNEGNTNDGDLFIYTNKIGMNAMGGYFGEIKDDTWYRIVLTNSEGKVKVYVDGEKLITCNSEGRWEIDPFGFYLFCDEDGEKVDTSSGISLTYGLHQLMAECEGYRTLTRYLSVGEENAGISITMEKEDRTVSGNDTPAASEEPPVTIPAPDDITTSSFYKVYINAPAGAECYIDGYYTGVVPCWFKRTTGSHVVTLSLAGYNTRSYTVTVEEGTGDLSFSFTDLEPQNP